MTLITLSPMLLDLLKMPKDQFAGPFLRQIPVVCPLPENSILVDIVSSIFVTPYFCHEDVVRSNNDRSRSLLDTIKLTDLVLGDFVQQHWHTLPDYQLYSVFKDWKVMTKYIYYSSELRHNDWWARKVYETKPRMERVD